MYLVAHSDGHDPPELIDPFVARAAAAIDKIVARFEWIAGRRA
jgi:hypothetical protein